MYRSHLRLSTWPTTGAIRTLQGDGQFYQFTRRLFLEVTDFEHNVVPGEKR